jgi:hypothetical protein
MAGSRVQFAGMGGCSLAKIGKLETGEILLLGF